MGVVVVVVVGADVHSPDGHVSVLGLAWMGTALQWCLGDSWHGLVHQHLLVLHSLTCGDTDPSHVTVRRMCGSHKVQTIMMFQSSTSLSIRL